MNETVNVNQALTEPTLGVKLCSWKWWVYGNMNSHPRERAPKGFLFQIFIVFFLWIFLSVHPWVSTWINRNPPQLSELQIVKGKVIYTSRKSPHLGLRMEDRKILDMEYPGFMSNLGSGPGGPKSLGYENSNVLGCEATVWFDIPKYTLWRRYRIWQISCNKTGKGASYKEFVEDSKRTMDAFGSGLLTFFFFPLFMGIFLIRFRGGFYER